MIVANRPFRFAGRDIDAGSEVVGENGQRPEGRTFGVLIRTGKIAVVDRDSAATVQTAGSRTEKSRRRAEQRST